MAIEIRKLPKWEETNIEGKLEIIRAYNSSNILLLGSLIGGASAAILTVSIEHAGELKENIWFIVLLVIWSISTLIIGIILSHFGTRKVK